MKTVIKSALAVAATTAAIAGVAAVPSMVSAFSRPLYSLQQVNEGALGNTITFNSIKLAETDAAWYKKTTGKDLPSTMLTNETNFVGAREDTGVNSAKTNRWEGNEITVEDGKTYVVRLYVHNNSPKGEKAVAKNTQVRFYVPYGSATSHTIDGWLKADNATPNQYLDDVVFKSKDGNSFHLEYVMDSALLENGKFAANGVKLTNSVVNQGNPTNKAEDEWTKIGYAGLDGNIPGCYEYVNYVTIRVKVVYDYDFTIQKQVRLADSEDKTWRETVEAKVGDKVQFQLTYQNTSTALQENVMIKDNLPNNLRYVPGSTKLSYIDANTHKQVVINITDGDPSDITKGINIGKYDPTAMAKIMFTAEVVDNSLACGSNTLINWGLAGVKDKTIHDDARVYVTKVCETAPEPTPEEPTVTVNELPKTGPSMVAGGVIAAGSTLTAAGYYIASRRQMR